MSEATNAPEQDVVLPVTPMDEQATETVEQPKQEPQKPTEKTYAQADVNKAYRDALAKTATTLGIDGIKSMNADQLATAIENAGKDYKETKRAKMTADEKLVADHEAAKKALEEKNAEYAEKETVYALKDACYTADVVPTAIQDVITLAKARMTDGKTAEDAIKEVTEAYPQFKRVQVVAETQKEAEKPKPAAGVVGKTPSEKGSDFEKRVNDKFIQFQKMRGKI